MSTAAVTVAKREIKTYFNSPVAYIVVTVFMLIAGYLYWSQLFLEKQAELRYYFTLTPLLFTFIVPAITMRLLAEEKGSGTQTGAAQSEAPLDSPAAFCAAPECCYA